MKFFLSLLATLALIYLLDKSWSVGGTRVPPVGKFLDPLNGFWQNAEPKRFIGPEDLRVNGLKDKVTVLYDSLLIPHIFANNEDDLFMAQGFITAMHRLWQMEFQTHAAAGRLASILGPGPNDAFLEYDRRQRRLGITFAAENAAEMMIKDPVQKRMLENYTEGINRYISSLQYKDLPLEYKLLDYKPEPWSILKCGLLLKNMAQTLNMGDKDIEMTNALRLYGKSMVDLLYPDREPGIDPIVSNPGGWNFDPVHLAETPAAVPDELIRITGMTKSNPDMGSNNWAVSGSKTATGAPILCNDPHLDTSLPSIWYAIHLNGPDVNVMGVSIPGSPGVIIGFNDSIAWGVTNAQRDLVDWYKITYKDSSRNHYLLDSVWTKTEKRVERIEVRDGHTFYDTVIYTKWGPVPYDRNFKADDNLSEYAFRWIAHDPSKEATAFYKLNRAKNYDEYMDALDHYASPAQNFAFASVSGDIAIRVQGKFPARRPEEGKFVLDGSKSENGWNTFIPLRQNISEKNPTRGFVSSANQYPVDRTYPYYITASSYESYRNRRINNVLRQLHDVTVTEMMRLQNDNYNMHAAESLPFMLSQLAVDTAALREEGEEGAALIRAYRALSRWDYFNNRDAEGASYFQAWWDTFMPRLWDEMHGLPYALRQPTTYNTVKLMKENSAREFYDIQHTEGQESLQDVIRNSFAVSVASIQDWMEARKLDKVRWADYKDTYVRHLARLEPLGFHVQHGGNANAVNASSKYHGPSWRMVVSLEKTGIKAYGVYPGGQSGNPGSFHYSDMLDSWANGKYFSLAFPKRIEDMQQFLLFETDLNPREKEREGL
ncbi:MAG TPA: penicillin acylase family protein [Cyclobacteriaceae bacterium]|nr:penicillin acylase family protein [Cyclobacteriaceae bacterium]